MIKISTLEQYNHYCSLGLKPLLQWRFFTLDINLRISIQNKLFSGSTIDKNNKFYHWIWENKTQVCEESGAPLYQYSSKFVSHILTRGAHREMATDPRNCNILTFKNHQTWETGKRENMSIYQANKFIINILKTDYANS